MYVNWLFFPSIHSLLQKEGKRKGGKEKGEKKRGKRKGGKEKGENNKILLLVSRQYYPIESILYQ